MTSAVDNTANTSPSSVTAAATAAARKNSMDKDSFLKLLVAQLQHQDPTQAQDSDKMVQQMTSFSSLEQMQNQTALLQGLQSQNVGMFQTQATGLVGKKVRISQGMNLKDGKADFVINLPSNTASTSISIKDGSGKVIRVLEKGAMPSGDHAITWDGRDSAGRRMEDGIYTIESECKDKTGAKVAATTSCFAHVESVFFGDGTAYVKAAGRTFSLADIAEVSAGSSTANTSPTQYAHLIGKHVRINGNIALDGGKSDFRLSLQSDSTSTQVVIRDQNNKMIRMLDLGSRMAGDHDIPWDGMDANGKKAPDGVYSVEVYAQDGKGTKIKGNASCLAKINSVLSSEGTILFNIAGRHFSLADISEITA